MKLSIVMMVRNESKYLEECLESLDPIRESIESELIIVDTGSEDSTVEIAKKFTDKVYYHKWNENFSEMRNISISYAKGQWIFIIDGDEIVENPEEMIKFLSSNKSFKYHCGLIKIWSITNENDLSKYSENQIPRLFKNTKNFHYEGRIHEQPIIEGPTTVVNLVLRHYGYLSTDKELMKKKFERNSKLLKSEIEKDPENIYYYHHLFSTYSMNKDKEKALEYALKAYNLAKEKNINIKNCMYIFADLAFAYRMNSKLEDLENVCNEAINVKDGYIDFYFFLASAQLELKKYEEAIKNYSRYLKLLKNYNQSLAGKDSTVTNYTLGYSDKAYNNLCILYDKTKNYNEVLEIHSRIQEESTLSNVLPIIVKSYFKLKKFKELKEYYIGEIASKCDGIRNKFIDAIEKYKIELEVNEINEFTTVFSNLDNEYGVLNKVRLALEDKEQVKDIDILGRIKQLDFKLLPPTIFGDVIYYLIKNKIILSDFLMDVSPKVIESYLVYITNKYKDFGLTFYDYLVRLNNKENLVDLSTKKLVEKYILLSSEITDEKYRSVLEEYIRDGLRYIVLIYNSNLLEQEQMNYLKNQEDVFLAYLYLAKKYKNKGKTQEYIRYLKKALNSYPAMNKVVKVLLNEIEESINYNTELEKFKKTVKNHIEELINNDEINDAKKLIVEYEAMVKDDVDVIGMKAIIDIIDGKLDEAEEKLKYGLLLNNDNFDLNYNMAYLLSNKSEFEGAISYYEKALQLTQDKEIQGEIIDNISKLKEITINDKDIEVNKFDIKNHNETSFERVKKVLYLGWLGKGNVGDDLLFEIFKKVLYSKIDKETNVIVDGYIPINFYEVSLEEYDLIVLGGGSIFGIPYWEKICLEAKKINIPVITWGTGLDLRDENNRETILTNFINRNNQISLKLNYTKEVVEYATLTGVRGEITKFLLNEESIDVIGDPGIIFNKLNNRYNNLDEVDNFIGSSSKTVLINWGTSYNNIFGKNEEKVSKELTKTVEKLLEEGYKVIVYPIWTEDIKFCKEFVNQFNHKNIFLINKVYDVYGIANIISKCKLSINLKLHSNILSMAMGKPFISLAYGIKCYDFCDSIEANDLIVPTDRVTSDKILEKVEFINDNYNAIKMLFEDKIEKYYKLQLEYMNKVVTLIRGNTKTVLESGNNEVAVTKDENSRNTNGFKSLGENVIIEKSNEFINPERIDIGSNVYIGAKGFYIGSGGIKIGNGSILAHKVEIMTRNHNYNSEDLKSIPYDGTYIHKPVIIEENVWIGSNVCIVPGVRIGEGAVVGMGSVVTKDVPKFAVVGGNPAKVVKYRDKDRYYKLKEQGNVYLKLKTQGKITFNSINVES